MPNPVEFNKPGNEIDLHLDLSWVVGYTSQSALGLLGQCGVALGRSSLHLDN